MEKRVFYLFLSSILAFATTACSDDEGKAIQPSVTISDTQVQDNSVTFTVNPNQAVACAYVYYQNGSQTLAAEQAPSAEQILTTGTTVSASAPTTVTIDDLERSAVYTVFVAVRSEDNLFAADSFEFSTGQQILPSVTISDVQVENNAVTFTVDPVQAVVCAYICYPVEASSLTADQLPDAEQILATGTEISASASTTVTIDTLTWETDYILAAAVRSADDLFAADTFMFSIGQEPATDLGTPANCYIVSEEGSYGFETKKVTGAAIADIATVDWIWATKSGSDDTQNLVTDIAYSGGRIRFNATGNRGNVVLAAFDANGTIVWSWHIWCTEQPETMTYENGKVFQDRYLGATAAVVGSTDSYGFYYQWGRKDPFYGGTEEEDPNTPFSQAVAQTVVNPEYGLGWKYIGEGADIARSIAEPMHFFHFENNISNDWTVETDNSLWGEEKTDYDPCPAGYRIPSSSEIADLKRLGEDDYDADNSGIKYTYNGQTAWYPAQGDRDIQGTLEIYPGWGSAFIWLNDWQTFGSSDFGNRLIIDEWGGMLAPGARSFGHTIRCVAE